MKGGKSMRKIIGVLVAICYLMAFPPFINLYNRPGFVLGIPTFIFGLIMNAICLVLSVLVLYCYENKRDEDEQKKYAK